jgi:hypothetical protein
LVINPIKEKVMSEKLEALRSKLHGKLDSGIDKMEKVQRSISADVVVAEGAVKAKLDEAKASAKQKMVDAKKHLTDLAEEKKLETEAEVAGWKEKRELKKLEKRAKRAENYAELCIDMALYAISDADEAVQEAVVAQMDVDAVL